MQPRFWAGNTADVLAVRDDPLKDLESLTAREQIEAVFVGGRQVVGRLATGDAAAAPCRPG